LPALNPPQFFLLLVLTTVLLVFCVPEASLAMGVSDFVAVADSPATALYNPAGLVNLEGKEFLLEHRLTGRDVALGWDDLAVYSVAEPAGVGALFLGYSQDLWSGSYYSRDQNIGYAYGWRPGKRIALGLTGKFGKHSIYNNYYGNMAKEYSKGDFMLDAGAIFTTTSRTKLGLTIHNIGKDDSAQAINYQSTLGFSYQAPNLTLACEIYDLFDQGNAPIDGSLGRMGVRYTIRPNFKLHAIVEESIGGWDFSGKMLGLEVMFKQVTVTASWYQADGDYLSEESLQATIQYHF
jgi:hypothetical protein